MRRASNSPSFWSLSVVESALRVRARSPSVDMPSWYPNPSASRPTFRASRPSSQEVLAMWSVKLSDDQREALCVMVKAQGESYDSDLRDALRALELARWDDLPEAALPWERVEELADAQGIDEADVVWDLTGGMPSKAERHAPLRSKTPRARV